MNTGALLWLGSVILVAIVLHLIVRGTIYLCNKKYYVDRPMPGHFRTIRRTLLALIWLVAFFLCSYAFAERSLYDTITENMLRSVWIGFVVLCCVIINAVVLNLFDKRIKEYAEADEKDPTGYKFFRYLTNFLVIVFGVILVALAIPGLRSAAQSALAGAGVIAVVLGIASQEVLGNIVSGTFIVISKPFRVGDIVNINDVVGHVEDITLRHTVVNSFQNKRIVIPNAVINKEKIINYNLTERKVCEWIEVGVSYDADIDKALALMQEEAAKHPYFYDNRTEAEVNREVPAVQAKVIGFGDSSVNLRAWVWARNYPAGFNMRLDLLKAIKQRFDAEGIEIPFPYRTLVFKNKEGDTSFPEPPEQTS